MAQKSLVQNLLNIVDELLAFNRERLIRRSEWGTITFEKAQLDLDRMFSIADYLKLLPVELLTDQTAQQIISGLSQCRDHTKLVDSFTLESSGNPASVRDDYVNRIRESADNLFTYASPWIPFLAYQKGDVSKNIASLTASVSKANELIGQAQQEMQVKRSEIDTIIVQAREASASAGAAVFTEDFSRQSRDLTASAQKWLYATGGFALITLLTAVVFFNLIKGDTEKLEVIQRAIAKVAILSILLTATVWCGRIYKALMHQAAIYRFKALGLQTFRAFSAGTANPQTKDAVLMETTRAIFSVQDTGYIDTDASDGGTKVVEIVKTAAAD